MKVIERWDERGNPIFEIGSKRIFFDMDLLRRLVSRNISIVNLNERFIAGRAWGSSTAGLNFSEIAFKKRKNHLIKKEIVSTLAHEVGHNLDAECKPIDKLVRRSEPLSHFLEKYLLRFFTLCMIASAIAVAFNFLSVVLILLFLVLLPLKLYSWLILIYYFSPRERHARAFAKEALKNEEWLKVVKVEDKDTP